MDVAGIPAVNPVKATPITELRVNFDNELDGNGDRHLLATPKGVRITAGIGVQEDTGLAGRSVSNGLLGLVNSHNDALAAIGSNVKHVGGRVPTASDNVTLHSGEWLISLNRNGSVNDQMLRGRFDDQLPVAVRDVLDAALSVENLAF
jgi:hypothetical protein